MQAVEKIRVRHEKNGPWFEYPVLEVGHIGVKIKDEQGPVWILYEPIHPEDKRRLTEASQAE